MAHLKLNYYVIKSLETKGGVINVMVLLLKVTYLTASNSFVRKQLTKR